MSRQPGFRTISSTISTTLAGLVWVSQYTWRLEIVRACGWCGPAGGSAAQANSDAGRNAGELARMSAVRAESAQQRGIHTGRKL